MLSRSFGDQNIKDVEVIVVQHVTRFEIDDNAQFCIIASYGVWDVLKDEECAILEKMQTTNTGEMNKIIIDECVKRKSLNNPNFFVISFN